MFWLLVLFLKEKSCYSDIENINHITFVVVLTLANFIIYISIEGT